MEIELDIFTPKSSLVKKFIKYSLNYNSSVFIQNVERNILFTESESQCSEYEIYFNFVQIYFPKFFKKRILQWQDVPVIKNSIIKNKNNDILSLPYYLSIRPLNLITNIAKHNLRLIYLKLINTYFFWTKRKY